MRARGFNLMRLAGLILALGGLACAPVTITIGQEATPGPGTPTLIPFSGPGTAPVVPAAATGAQPTAGPTGQATDQLTAAPADQITESSIDQSTELPDAQVTTPPDQASEDTQHLDTVTEEPATFEAVDVPTPVPDTPNAGSSAVSGGAQGSFFQTYTIQVAPGWSAAHVTNPPGPSDKLTLTKDGYSLVIEQAGQGISACLYGGQPTPTGGSNLWIEFSNVGFITGAGGEYLRGTNDGLAYTVCIKNGDSYNSVTPFGAISYTVPDPPDPQVLADMDNMVASITH